MSLARILRWAGPAAVVGGVLWMVYGVFFMLEPWGPADVYYEDLGEGAITSWPLFWLYTLPGSLALVLTAVALLGIIHKSGGPKSQFGEAGTAITYVTLGLAVLSLVGAATLSAPLSFMGRAFASLALGAATLLVGIDHWRASTGAPWALMLLGSLGLLMLPLQPLVWALQIIPASIAAGIIGLFGLGWLILGYRLGPPSSTAGTSDTA
jgi:hypothetical protein